MSDLVLVDTSSWTQTLRRNGDASVRARVAELTSKQVAAWCDMVRLELWAGVRGQEERDALEELGHSLPLIPTTAEVWDRAAEYAWAARSKGITVPAPDLLIFSCARQFGLRVERADRHYDLLETL